MLRIRCLLLPLLLLGALTAGASPAWARWLEVESFHADITIEADGSVLVKERVRVEFQGQWNGIYRSIKIGYTYARGVRGTIRVELLGIEGADGRALEHWVERRDSYLNLKIRVPGAADATRDVVIRYRARNVVRTQDYGAEDYGVQDEFFWNVTGDEWDMPIRQATARVRLPATVPADRVQAKAYTGRDGQRGTDYETTRGPASEIHFETTAPLAPGEGLTVVVIFPPGFVEHPSALTRTGWWLQDNWFLAIPLLLVVLWWLAWRRWGRDPMDRRTIIPEWEPPDALQPAEVGVLVDDRFDRRDLSAAIVQLAVQGVLSIHELEKDDDFRLELHPEARAGASLRAHQKRLLDSLFEDDATEVKLSDLEHEFVGGLKKVRNSVLDRLVSKGYFQKRPDKVVERWSGYAFLTLVALGILGWALRAPLPYWILAALAAVGVFVIARQMPRRTKRGLDALARIRGMEEYLLTAEKERMRVAPLDHFETLLPFAIALGVQKRWAKTFEGLLEKPPEWMHTTRAGFTASMFDSSLSNMDNRVGSTLMSGPRAARSTGGSGWSGGWSGGGGFSGGSSGGGFGGGGGGGW